MLEVIEPGLLTTIQDLGRPGLGHLGISPSGAADPLALRLGNRLLGNPENTPALEMTLLGGAFLFHKDATVALAGSDFEVPLYTPIPVKAGGILRTGRTRGGARCYVCIQGGLDLKRYWGSASAHLLSGLGGQPLRKGDRISLLPPSGPTTKIPNPPPYRKIFRVTPGPQWDSFSPETRQTFLDSPYQVTEEANRMGLRLKGPALAFPHEILTEGVPLGAIQIPPAGHPIILFVEQQTTGGYPKIATVIAADLPSLGQLRPRDHIRFELVTYPAARTFLQEQEDYLRS